MKKLIGKSVQKLVSQLGYTLLKKDSVKEYQELIAAGREFNFLRIIRGRHLNI